MVLAAGFGTRLGELTKETPKCLVVLADKTTMLQRVLLQLKQAGVTEVIVNLHYLGHKIKEYLLLHKNFGVEIEFSNEEKILGTGGGLKKARHFFSDAKPFFLHNSDVWCDMNLKKFYESHEKQNPLVSLAVTKRETKRPLYFDSNMSLLPITNNDNGNGIPFGFSGVQIVDPRFFNFLDEFQDEFSTIPAFFSAVRQGETVQGFDISKSYWIDMGSPEKLKALNEKIGKK